jgi:hypothetical protein
MLTSYGVLFLLQRRYHVFIQSLDLSGRKNIAVWRHIVQTLAHRIYEPMFVSLREGPQIKGRDAGTHQLITVATLAELLIQDSSLSDGISTIGQRGLGNAESAYKHNYSA